MRMRNSSRTWQPGLVDDPSYAPGSDGARRPEERLGDPARRGRDRGAPTREPRRSRPGSRQSRLTLAGLVLVVICGLLGAAFARSENRRVLYLALAHQVPQGAPLAAGDLSTVSLAPPQGLAPIPASQSRAVVGARTAATLERGSLLVLADLATNASAPAKTALVGTSLQPDHVPGGLEPGDSVLIVLASGSPQAVTSGTAGSSSGASTGAVPTIAGTAGPITAMARGTVYSVGGSAGSSGQTGELVTLAVAPALAPEIAADSAAGSIALAEVPAPPTRRGASRRPAQHSGMTP